MWLLDESGRSLNGKLELADVRMLVWRHAGSQFAVCGARIDGCEAKTIQIAVPLPCPAIPNGTAGCAGGVAVLPSAKSREAHLVLQRCISAFPEVVKESLLHERSNAHDKDGDAEMRDDDDESDEDNASTLKVLATKFQEQTAEARETPPENFFETTLLGLRDSQQIEGGEYRELNGVVLLLKVAPTSDSGYFAFGYSFEPHEDFQGSLVAPVSTVGQAPGGEELHHLAPVTKKMDHRIFSIGSVRNSGTIHCAGKTAEEMLRDMRLRHASGTCTVILEPTLSLRHIVENLVPLFDASIEDARLLEQPFRLRRIVGPYNTTVDVHLSTKEGGDSD